MIHKGEYIKDILARDPGARLDAYGWVKTRRDGKGVHFAGSEPRHDGAAIPEAPPIFP